MSIIKTPKENRMETRIEIYDRAGSACVKGYVYPFTKRFHSVSFEAKLTTVLNSGNTVPETSVGFGGNSHVGVDADRMIAAATTANELAKHYAGIIVDMQDPNTAVEVITEALANGDIKQAEEYVLLTMDLGASLPKSCNWNFRRSIKSETIFDGIVRSDQFGAILSKIEAGIQKFIETEDASDYVESNEDDFFLSLFLKAKRCKVSSFEKDVLQAMLSHTQMIRSDSEATIKTFKA